MGGASGVSWPVVFPPTEVGGDTGERATQGRGPGRICERYFASFDLVSMEQRLVG